MPKTCCVYCLPTPGEARPGGVRTGIQKGAQTHLCWAARTPLIMDSSLALELGKDEKDISKQNAMCDLASSSLHQQIYSLTS